MADLPNGLTQDEVDEYLKLDAGIKRLQVRHDILNEKIKNAHQGKKAQAYVYGGVIVTIQDKTKFDAEEAEEALPYYDPKNRKLYRHVIDPEALQPDVKAKFTHHATRALIVRKAN